jgi:hypothetical protein
MSDEHIALFERVGITPTQAAPAASNDALCEPLVAAIKAAGVEKGCDRFVEI